MKKIKANISDIFLSKSVSDDILEITLIAPLTLKYGNYYDKYLKFKSIRHSKIIFDYSKIQEFDSFLVVFTNGLNSLSEKYNKTIEIIGTTKEQNSFINLLCKRLGDPNPEKEKKSGLIRYFEAVGNFAKQVYSDVYSFIDFIGNLIIAMVSIIYKPSSIRWKDFPFNFAKSGVNAVPIVLLILFLLGLITGYQGAIQLKQFGADKFIADLVGISITRELAPLMTAILVAGRSGSAFAAEIGTMKVSEEIDALKTMGIDLYKFLVLPRVLAVTLSIPFVTILADITGIAGGLLASLATLNITFTGYINELQSALTFAHIFSGLGKSMIFGFLVASVGCFRGLQASGGAESVGKYTTAAVVSGVLLIILSDAVFTFVFQIFGI